MKKRRSEDKKQNGTKVWSETQGMSPAVCIHCVEGTNRLLSIKIKLAIKKAVLLLISGVLIQLLFFRSKFLQ